MRPRPRTRTGVHHHQLGSWPRMMSTKVEVAESAVLANRSDIRTDDTDKY